MAIRLSLKCGLLWYTVIIRKSLGLDEKKVALRRVIFVSIQNAKKKKHNYVSRFLLACRETGSLPEEVKQKDNLCEHNIQLQLRISIDICGLFATFFS